MAGELVLPGLAAASALLGGGMLAEAFAVQLVRLKLSCPHLPEPFRGFRILQISDLHMSKMGFRERRMARLVRGLNPDIVALTGDLAADEVSARELAGIVHGASPGLGAFAISGNADVRYPQAWAGVKRVLRDEGIIMLENQHRVLERGGTRLVLAGVEDPHTGLDDLPAALDGAPAGAFTILLAHSPAIILPAVDRHVDLMLSGHTHGGQLVIPGFGPLLTRSGYGAQLSSGLFRGKKLAKVISNHPGHTQVYISRGLGHSLLPIRLLCRPEVTLFELSQSGAST